MREAAGRADAAASIDLMKKVSYPQLESALLVFLNKFYDLEISKSIAEVILWAERHNKEGQGLLKLVGTEPLQNIKAAGPLSVIERTPVSAVINGNKQPSFFVAQRAVNIAIEKGKSHGFALVGANNIFSSVGALGFYAERMAAENLIGFIMARSPGSTAPFNLRVPAFGTNPFAAGFPADPPIVFDMATSAITWYELVLAKMRKQEIHLGVAIDEKGEITTDPSKVMNGGAILPFDKSYKGSSLSLMVELMSGPLVGSSYCDFKTFDKDWGVFILCFNPNLLIDTEEFKKSATDLYNTLRQQKTLTGNPVRLPEDSGRAFEQKIFKEKFIDIENEIAKLLAL